MSKKNERKPKANGKGKKNEKETKAKKPVMGKTVTGRNKSSGAGKTATGKQASSWQATPPAKRTVPKLRQNKAQSNARKRKQEEKESRKNGTPIPKKETTVKTSKPKKKKEYEKPLITRPVTIKDHKDKKGKHPHAIMDEIDNKNVSVGLTTDNKKGHNSTNRKCEIDPLGTGEQSYMRRQGTVARKQEYDNESKRVGKMSINDYAQAEIYAERAKQKYLAKKAQKKDSRQPNTH